VKRKRKKKRQTNKEKKTLTKKPWGKQITGVEITGGRVVFATVGIKKDVKERKRGIGGGRDQAGQRTYVTYPLEKGKKGGMGIKTGNRPRNDQTKGVETCG